jgi:hypothetical protein
MWRELFELIECPDPESGESGVCNKNWTCLDAALESFFWIASAYPGGTSCSGLGDYIQNDNLFCDATSGPVQAKACLDYNRGDDGECAYKDNKDNIITNLNPGLVNDWDYGLEGQPSRLAGIEVLAKPYDCFSTTNEYVSEKCKPYVTSGQITGWCCPTPVYDDNGNFDYWDYPACYCIIHPGDTPDVCQ